MSSVFGAEFGLPHRTQRDVGVAPQRPFLHVAVANFQIKEDIPQALEVFHRLVRGAHVRLADDFDQRHPGAVKIHQAHRPGLAVDEFARIFFHVDAGDAQAPGLGRRP